jgi:hypothetical protein
MWAANVSGQTIQPPIGTPLPDPPQVESPFELRAINDPDTGKGAFVFKGREVPPVTRAVPGGWLGYSPLESNGFQHEITYLKGNKKTASELLPRVHLVISHLKRWLLGTHQGAVSHKHLDYYLDEFTFRFNRRRSKLRGKLLYRLAQQAVAVDPVPLDQILHPDSREKKPQPVAFT